MITMSFAVFSQTVLFEENFDDGAAATNWTALQIGTSNIVTYDFDYIAAGLDAAPNGGGLGLKIEVNTTEGAASQVMLFPTDGTFTGDYFMTCDVWMNVEGTDGTTEFAAFGVKTTSTVLPQSTGVEFLLTTEGGSGSDIRVYDAGEHLVFVEEPVGEYNYVYADQVNGQNVSWSDDGGNPVSSPIYGQSFTGDNNSNQWLSMTVQVTADSVFFSVSDIRWAQVLSAPVDGNIEIGYMDMWSSLAAEPCFIIYDNIKVTAGNSGVNNIVSNNVSLYPNPATDLLNVTVKENSTFELIDITGKTVLNRMIEGTSTINISRLSSGMYLAKVTSESGVTEISKVLVK